ncbi:MAG: helix-turn-helix domain-containing protein [Clostridia bacterium]|nr:helix-turn-helix domain-containing protein [Clostridia bacterium]
MGYDTLSIQSEFSNSNEFHVRYIRSDIEGFVPHKHKFYEIFLTTKGTLLHIVNDTLQTIEAGSLLFIRDFDHHYYSATGSEPFEFINFSFKKDALTELFAYLGNGFPSEVLFESKMPPAAMLLPNEQEKLLYSILELNSFENPLEANSRMRTLLFNVFTKYFHNYSPEHCDIPLWLEIAYEKMKSPANFVLGGDRLVELSGKSREHIARCMKKYYNITPFEFITNLRMNYAANLMRTSNLSITDICFECGFSNLSWFYKVFEATYNTTPAKYKKALTEAVPEERTLGKRNSE